MWGMKIIALEESTGFATLDTEKLFSRLKSHELSHKGRHNHDASLTCKAKPCENYKMIMVNYADMWLVHTQVASQLKGAKLELKELKAHSLLLGACTSCPMLRSNLEACAIEIKDLKYIIDHSSRYSVLSLPCKMCSSLKGKLFHATKENTKLKQEVA
jgi:hypothetical protein